MHSFYVPTRRRVSVDCGTHLITKQEFKEESDINYILNQYKKTGIINNIMKQQPIYTDLPDELDYQHSMNITMQASDAFQTLPAVVRRYFDNDPLQLVAAVHNPDMRATLEELGVLEGPLNPQPPGNPVNRNPSTAGSLTTTPQLPIQPAPNPPATPNGDPTLI